MRSWPATVAIVHCVDGVEYQLNFDAKVNNYKQMILFKMYFQFDLNPSCIILLFWQICAGL